MNVEELLAANNIVFKQKGNDFVVTCLNPEHPDRHPSMRIDCITGIFNCFACGFKGNIFHHFGESFSPLQIKRETLKKKIKLKSAETVGLQLPSSAVPYDGNWRDIKPETYKKFEAFLDHTGEFNGRVVFPIRNITGRIVAFQGRHMTGGTPKYIFSPRGVKLPLYPIAEPIKGAVLLVEGIYDVINLYDKGLTNAMCCFGVSNVNEDKLSILRMKGVDTIDIFFDGDEAGQGGAKKVKKLCEKLEFNSRNICIDGKDPGALSEESVVKLRKKLY